MWKPQLMLTKTLWVLHALFSFCMPCSHLFVFLSKRTSLFTCTAYVSSAMTDQSILPFPVPPVSDMPRWIFQHYQVHLYGVVPEPLSGDWSILPNPDWLETPLNLQFFRPRTLIWIYHSALLLLKDAITSLCHTSFSRSGITFQTKGLLAKRLDQNFFVKACDHL